MVSVHDLQSFISARAYKWEVSFPSYSSNFFPAIGLDDSLFEVELGQLTAGPYPAFFFQKVTKATDVTVTIVVDNDYGVISWLEEWYNSIYKGDFRVAFMSDTQAVRPMLVHYCSIDNSYKLTRQLKVTISGTITLNPSSDPSSVLQLSLPLKILAAEVG